MQSYSNIIEYISYVVYYNPVIYFLNFYIFTFMSLIPFYLFYNLEFVPLKFPHLFHLFPPPPSIHFLYGVREVGDSF